MKKSGQVTRLGLALLLASVPFAPTIDPGRWPIASAFAQDIAAKEAFEAAKELGTVEAWNAFLASYPTGFYADLARAYIVKLGGPAAPRPAVTAAPARRGARNERGSQSRAWREREPGWRAPPPGRQPLAPRHLGGPRRSEFAARFSRASVSTSRSAPTSAPSTKARRWASSMSSSPATRRRCRSRSPKRAKRAIRVPIQSRPTRRSKAGPKGTGDRHVIVLDRDNWQLLFELFNAFPDRRRLEGGRRRDLESEAEPGPAGPAGPPRMPPACRSSPASCVTTRRWARTRSSTRSASRSARRAAPMCRPASHWASAAHDDNLPPDGHARASQGGLRHLRLRSRGAGDPARR